MKTFDERRNSVEQYMTRIRKNRKKGIIAATSLCLVLALVLCFGIVPPAAPVQAATAEETTAELPESIDDFHMTVAAQRYVTNKSDYLYWTLRLIPLDFNYPITGVKLVFEYERGKVGFYATDSAPRDRFDEAYTDSDRNSEICVATVTGSSEKPISFLSAGLIDLQFGRSSMGHEYYPFDIRITEFVIYVPLADGTIGEYTPDYPELMHVPLTEDGSSDLYLGPKRTAEMENCIAWGNISAMVWSLRQDGTLAIEGASSFPSFNNTDNLAPWMPYKDQIKKVVIRNGILNVGEYAFYGCTNLEEVVFPSIYTESSGGQFYIRESAFDGCTSLKKISALPDTAGSSLDIQTRAFAGTALTTFHVPAEVEVARDAFAGNTKLTHFTADDDAMYEVDPYGALIYPSSNWSMIQVFPQGMEGEYYAPNDTESILEGTFADTPKLTKIVLGSFERLGGKIESGAFRNCAAAEIYFPEGPPTSIAEDAFENVTATIYYNADKTSWTEEKMQQYGGNLTWVAHKHDYTVTLVPATCTEMGFTAYSCKTCGYYYESDGNTSALGHDLGEPVVTKEPTCLTGGIESSYCSRCDYEQQTTIYAKGHSWVDTAEEGIHTCTACSLTEGKYRIRMPNGIIDGDTAWVDGVEYPIQKETYRYIALSHPNATSLCAFKYRNAESEDIHEQYPSTMQTWLLSGSSGSSLYGVKEYEDLRYNSLLLYAGCSIRIKGVKGIRMITGVYKETKKNLTSNNAGNPGHISYKLMEYGTLLAWAKDLEGGNPLTLGQPYVKSNYAYKSGVADPVYSTSGTHVYYTNVLVGFTNEQCKDDIAMRPYLIIEDSNGKQYTIYGGIVYRSIGYIAYQNRNAFQAGTAAYEYVWDIIHYVYGDQYDAEYKGKK